MRLTVDALLVGVACSVIPASAEAHELDVDKLRLWLEPSGKLRGQLLIDPELTRTEKEPVSDAVARERVQEFIAQNLSLTTDGIPCSLAPEVRELYVLGGAAPADVVMLQCSPGKPLRHLELSLADGFERVAVEAVGFARSDGRDDAASPAPELVSGGSTLSFTRRSANSFGADSSSGASKGTSSQATDDALPAWIRTLTRFLWLGVEHIVPGGLDHVLFVVGVTLSQSRWRVLLVELLAFTLAHTLTLVLATFGWVAVSPSWVEPLIALSIVVVALLNLRASKPKDHRARLGLCFGFGLIHGLGFAGALGGLGMAKETFVPALLGFNLGVELGQVLVAGCAVGILAWLRRKYPARNLPRWVALLVALSGFVLLLSRLV